MTIVVRKSIQNNEAFTTTINNQIIIVLIVPGGTAEKTSLFPNTPAHIPVSPGSPEPLDHAKNFKINSMMLSYLIASNILAGSSTVLLASEVKSKEVAVIMDIDGTIADESDRRAKATENGKINWDEYFDPKRLSLDKPVKEARKVLNELSRMGVKIIYVSSRPESLRKATLEWLKKNGFPEGKLYLRRKFERTLDFKKRVCKYLAKKYRVIAAVGDREKDIVAYKYAGLKAYKVAPASDKDWKKIGPELLKLARKSTRASSK